MGWVERAAAMVAGVVLMAATASFFVADADEPRPVPIAHAVATVSVPAVPVATKAEIIPAAPTAQPKKAIAVRRPMVGAVTTTRDTVLRTKPWLAAKSIGPVPAGILSPVTDQKWGFYKVLTPNQNVGWLHKSKVKTHEKGKSNPARLEDATIVIDPGHGGHQPGAIGPGGFTEKDANLAIAQATVAKLKGARVFLTRIERHAGIAYRAGLANRLGAVAFVSVHNNSNPVHTGSKIPGVEVYHRLEHQKSERLARLIHEEIVQVLKDFKVGWARNPTVGPKARRSHDHGGDYYGLLRWARVPAVIVENMFISNKAEEKLLRRPEVRNQLADAIARGIKRFVETGA